MIDTAAIKARFERLAPYLDERARRLFAANEALTAGWGGITAVSEATGVARSTIGRGLAELQSESAPQSRRIRRPGGGSKPKTQTEPGLRAALEELVQSAIRGDPEAALLWVSRSQRHLVRALAERGFTAVRNWSAGCCDSLASAFRPTETREGASHPDRNAQFEHINEKIKQFQAAGSLPSLSTQRRRTGRRPSRMADANSAPKRSRTRARSRFQIPDLARLRPTASTTSPQLGLG
jgi:hypothetical protein